MRDPLTSNANDVDYWAESQRPWVSLLFVLPFLGLYEFGARSLASASQPTGADRWLREGFLHAGLEIPWLLPSCLILVLLGWHQITKQPWRCRWQTLTGMFGESLLFAMILVLLGQGLHLAFRHAGLPTAPGTVASLSISTKSLGFLGAGIYEEVLFRLLLLPALYGGCRCLQLGRGSAAGVALLATSLLFAAAHYLGPGMSPFQLQSLAAACCRVLRDDALWFSFLFRALAGGLFAGLFFTRGFGVTVGCHAIYDLIVGGVMS